MHLAFITSSFPPYISGVAVNAVNITTGLANRGHQTGVFTPTYPEPITFKSSLANPNLHLFRLPSFRNPFKTAHRLLSPFPTPLLSQLSVFKPDIIHLQEPQFFLFSAIKNYASDKHIPVVCAHHFPPEFITNQLPTWLRKKTIDRLIIRVVINLYHQSDLVITPTKTMKKLLTDNGLKLPVAVISNGVDINKYTPQSHSRLSPPVLLCLGRVDFDKNLDILIRAVKHTKSNYTLWIAGGGSATNFLKSLTSKLNLENHIKFLGYIPEEKKVDLYRQATVFVLPSTAEAQSIVSLESAACGLPLILANSAALPELINPDHPNGVLFSPNDPIDLATKIDLLLSNPQRLTKMGENSRRLAKTHDLNKVISDYEQTYLSLTSNKQ